MAATPESDGPGEGASSTVLLKRPLFVLNKAQHEIYLTGRQPTCVYYERALYLLRWRLSRLPELCSRQFLQDNFLNRNTGTMGNRAKLPEQHGRSVGDAQQVSSAFSKRNEMPPRGIGDCVVLYGTGRCVTRALFVLHDLYEHVKDLYVEAQSRFRRRPVRVLCAECSATPLDAPDARVKHGLDDGCAGCEEATNKALEVIVKRILQVEISTGSVACCDDVYSYASRESSSSSGENFYPMRSTDAVVTVSQRERMISSIKICIRVASK
ncbi:ubiquitin- ligase e3 component, putative [Babesia ovata]|uniref:Ubiquitin-ligase e3 component, putative n=1 Tax=Babesia ovata TaxID=189622 RepID=A0A2H6KAU1_9APIC|nr:ubiquitin- ligase e3 component, putative [Babesia ovata]GBE60117.1 ubiquitin- ligase e3 component, putative [Babesia ovata]